MMIPNKSALLVVKVLQKALLQGPKTANELALLFAGNVREIILDFIDHLRKKRFIIAEDETPDSVTAEAAQDIFYWHFNKHQEQVSQILNEKPWAFVGINKMNKQIIETLLKDGKEGIIVVDDPSLRNVEFFDDEFHLTDEFWKSENLIVTTDDAFEKNTVDYGFIISGSEFGSFYLLERWNSFAVKNKVPFYPVVLQNMVGYAGPLVIPQEGACLECLKARQNSNSPRFEEKRLAEQYAFEGQDTTAYHNTMLTMLAQVASFDLIKFNSNIQWEIGTIREIDLLSGSMTRRKLIKAPRCKTCSDAPKLPLINIRKQMTTDEAWAEIEQTVGYHE